MYLAKAVVTASAFFSLARSGNIYDVVVGNGGNIFSPESYSNVVQGDTIRFNFNYTHPHSASQSSFDSPCSALSPQALDSGVIQSSSQFSVPINDTSSLWFYCKVQGHCKSGMVFAVNPSDDQPLAAFKAKATGQSVSSGSSGSSTSASSSSSSTPTGTVSGNTKASSGAKTTVQNLSAGLAGAAFLVKWFL